MIAAPPPGSLAAEFPLLAPPPGPPPGIAVIIPAHRQPALLAEALASVLAQRGVEAFAVVVEDGCPYPETSSIALAFATAHPGRVFALAQPNGGLSAARNAGIGFVLAALPGCRYVHFLDADNRLEPLFLARAAAALAAAPPRVGWVYPDIDAFGWPMQAGMAGAYSVLAHLFDNCSDAGSLVRRDLLAGGLRFDEAMRDGFEDWDFWLQAVARGWRGQHLPWAGFRYRRRPDSMVSAAERQRPWLTLSLQRKHAALLAPRHLLQLEAQEAPRFAIQEAPGAEIHCCLDPDAGGVVVPPATAARQLLASRAAPAACAAPGVWIFAAPGTLALLRQQGLLHGLLWQMQRALRHHAAVALHLQPGEPDAILLRPGGGGALALQDAALLCLSARGLLQAMEEDTTGDPLAGHERLLLTLPAGLPLPSPGLALAALQRQLALLRDQPQQAAVPAVDWRPEYRHRRGDLAQQAQALHGIGTTLALLPAPGRRDIAFLLPQLGFGGAERVMLNQAAVFRRRGWRTHLVVLGEVGITASALLRDAFDHLHITDLTAVADVAPGRYFGAPVSRFGDSLAAEDLLGLLVGMDAVIASNSPHALAVMGRLRRFGPRCYAALHQVELTEWGMPLGQPHLLLGHEHALDGVTVISAALRDTCLGLGLPRDKLLLVRNAPGYASTPARIAAALAGRTARPPGRRLRALYIGRLDAQKHSARLDAIIRATRDAVDWRVVGGLLLDGRHALGTDIMVEPPVQDAAALDDAYAWADLVVLPSRYEGVPLALLEAQRLGAVPLATAVGAVAEIITHGRDGLLVDPGQPEAAIRAGFIHHLRRLAADPAPLAAMAAAAAARVAACDWETSLEPFLQHLDSLLPEQSTP